MLNQQRIAAVLRAFATDIQNDPPALTPVAVNAVYHNTLIACDSSGSGITYTTDNRLRCLLSMVRFCQCGERRADQLQNNPDNCQSHEQFDQAESLLMHVISFPGVLRPARSLRE